MKQERLWSWNWCTPLQVNNPTKVKMRVIIRQSQKIGIMLASILSYSSTVHADFIYEDFNQTFGLTINGNAATSGCHGNETYTTNGEYETKSWNSTNHINDTVIIGKGNDLQMKETVTTNENDSLDDAHIHEMEAQFGHREIYLPSLKTGCKRRLRLTPSSPSQVGSVFYEKRLPVVSSYKSILCSIIVRIQLLNT